MGDFCYAADLNKCLIGISPRYSIYTTDLWDNIRSPAELANMSVMTLVKRGVSNVVHAENIQAQVKHTGKENKHSAVFA